MKILISVFTFYPDSNGIANAALNIASGLQRKGMEVCVATTRNALRTENTPEGIRVVEFEISGNGNLLRPFSGEKQEYKDFLLESAFDVLIFYCWYSWPAELPIKYLHHIKGKKILYSHGTAFFDKQALKSIISIMRILLYIPLNISFKRKLSAFDHYIFLADCFKRERFNDRILMDKLGKTNFSIVPNGTIGYHSEPGSFRKEFDIPDHAFLVLNVANYQRVKNQLRLVRNFSEANIPGSVLVIIGSVFNDCSKPIIDFAAQFNSKHADRRILVLEKIPVPRIHAAYTDCNVFALSSRTEVQPLVLLDTLPYGKPFVSTDVGCIAELTNGMIAANDDEYIQALTRLSTDKELWQKLSENARRHYTEKFHWEKIIATFTDIIIQVKNSR